MDKPKKLYQVWAMLRTEHGTQAWHAVTEKYPMRRDAERVANALWLETRIDVSDDDPED